MYYFSFQVWQSVELVECSTSEDTYKWIDARKPSVEFWHEKQQNPFRQNQSFPVTTMLKCSSTINLLVALFRGRDLEKTKNAQAQVSAPKKVAVDQNYKPKHLPASTSLGELNTWAKEFYGFRFYNRLPTLLKGFNSKCHSSRPMQQECFLFDIYKTLL